MNKIFRRGALIFSCVAFAAAAFMLFDTALALLSTLAFVILSNIFAFVKNKPEKRAAVVLALLCLFGSSTGTASALICKGAVTKTLSLCDEETHYVVAVVEKEIYAEQFGSEYDIRTIEVDGEKFNANSRLVLEYHGGFEEGDEIVFYGLFSEPDEDDAPYLKSKNVFVTCSAGDAETVSGEKISVFKKINRFFENAFYEKMSERGANFASAVFLGNREKAEPNVKLAFKRSGLSHILALSGLHLAIVSLGIDFLLRRAGLNKKIRLILTVISVVSFALITGLSASVFRSAIMLVVFYAAQFFGEKNDSLTALVFALAVIICVRPYSVWDSGFLMSFSATLGLVLFSDVLTPKFAAMKRENYSKPKKILRGIVSYFVGLLSVGVIATAFTLPITYFAFGGVSLISALANIIVIPMIQLLLYLLLIFCVVCKIPFISDGAAFICDGLISAAEKTTGLFSSIKGVYVSVRYPFTPYILAAFAVTVLLIIVIPKIKKVYIFAATAALCVVFAACLGIYSSATANDVYAVCVNEKSNDAVGVVYRGENVVIDVSSGGFSTLYNAVKATEGRAASEVSAVVLTHLHRNHVHTVEKLAGYVKINTLIIPSAESESDAETIRDISAICGANGIKTEFFNRRSDSYMDILDLTVKLPRFEVLKRSSHPVISFTVSAGEDDVLMYLGSSFWECDGSPDKIECPVVFFGIHGPKPQDVNNKEMNVKSNVNICSNETIAEIFGVTENVISKHKGKITVLTER